MGKKGRFSRFQRDIEKNTLEESERILIVCEGTCTEPSYFKRFEVASATVKVIGTGKNTQSLVKEAQRQSELDEYDQVWCVFDKDSFSNQQFNTACQMAQQYGFHLAYSNESFELWYVLHFGLMQAQLNRQQCMKKLTADFQANFKRPYKKNAEDTYDLLLEKQNDALRNAKILARQYHGTNTQPAARFPVTYVYQLVEVLNEYSRGNRW